MKNSHSISNKEHINLVFGTVEFYMGNCVHFLGVDKIKFHTQNYSFTDKEFTNSLFKIELKSPNLFSECRLCYLCGVVNQSQTFSIIISAAKVS